MKEFDIHSPVTLFERINSLWHYTTTEWFSLREISGRDLTRSRWSVVPWWIEMSDIELREKQVPAARETKKAVELSKNS